MTATPWHLSHPYQEVEMTEHFAITKQAIDPNALREQLTQKANCGAFCSF